VIHNNTGKDAETMLLFYGNTFRMFAWKSCLLFVALRPLGFLARVVILGFIMLQYLCIKSQIAQKSIIYLHRQFYVKGHAINVTVDCLRVIGLKSMGSLHFLCELRMNN